VINGRLKEYAVSVFEVEVEVKAADSSKKKNGNYVPVYKVF
jgi:hypothetical protein